MFKPGDKIIYTPPDWVNNLTRNTLTIHRGQIFTFARYNTYTKTLLLVEGMNYQFSSAHFRLLTSKEPEDWL